MPETRRVLITGATRGLGRALVHRFAEAGWVVAGCGSNRDLVTDLARQYPQPHTFRRVDVARDSEVRDWIADLSATTDRPPDLVINNAAVINNTKPLWEVTAEEFDRLLAINVSGVANVIRSVVPWMLPLQRGVIVNLSSGWGRSTSPDVAPYCASKYAIEGLTQSLAQELPAGMAAVPLNPGVINTDMLQSCWAAGADQYPTADEWSRRAAPFLMQLGPRDNGRSLTVP